MSHPPGPWCRRSPSGHLSSQHSSPWWWNPQTQNGNTVYGSGKLRTVSWMHLIISVMPQVCEFEPWSKEYCVFISCQSSFFKALNTAHLQSTEVTFSIFAHNQFYGIVNLGVDSIYKTKYWQHPPPLCERRGSEYGQGEEEEGHMVSSQAPVTWFMFAGGVFDRSLCKKWEPSVFLHVPCSNSGLVWISSMEIPAINLKVSVPLAGLKVAVLWYLRRLVCTSKHRALQQRDSWFWHLGVKRDFVWPQIFFLSPGHSNCALAAHNVVSVITRLLSTKQRNFTPLLESIFTHIHNFRVSPSSSGLFICVGLQPGDV